VRQGLLREGQRRASDNRPQLCRLLKVVDVGDVVIVTRLDPCAKHEGPLEHDHELNEAGAKFKSIADVAIQVRRSASWC